MKGNRWINKIALSAFAVYLFHYHEMILYNFYTDVINKLYLNENSGTFVLYTLLWMLLIFILSILMDQFRILFWSIILRIISFIKGV